MKQWIVKHIKYILLLVGIAGTAWLIIDTGIAQISEQFQKLGIAGLLFLIPYLAVYTSDTWGWRFSYTKEVALPSFWTMLRIKLAGEAINYTLPGGYVGGEPLKAFLMTKHNILLKQSLASVLIAKFLMTIAEVFFILVGLQLAFLSLKHHNFLYIAITGLVLFAIVLFAFLRLQQRGLAGILSRGLSKISVAKRFIAQHQEALVGFDDVVALYYKNKKRMLLGCVCFLLGWCFGASEIYIFLSLMGQQFPLYQIFVLEAMFVTVKGMGTIVPGSVGIQEGGIAGAFHLFYGDPTLGITFGLLRRCREIVWILIGLGFLSKDWDKSLLPEFQATKLATE